MAGNYLACLLYKSYLLLATVSKAGNRYNVKFAITLATARIEEANQGRGRDPAFFSRNSVDLFSPLITNKA